MVLYWGVVSYLSIECSEVLCIVYRKRYIMTFLWY